ncbi:permease-like cell division protein FtsX [Sphaerimonospora thailandensis]|uniref:FtsX extracellular domain-containing protein n=1 Tax=Sphaerimonospora thailandensis TaxID=795644 RepID=A0A8J3REA5_9ACTN|nr:permease-like cell division protein FtsX [Sphaerimonospora thailandensis]GIH72681.1 hypothetical protein Mth01_49340 [Sphaerimonospora thailandensis]
MDQYAGEAGEREAPSQGDVWGRRVRLSWLLVGTLLACGVIAFTAWRILSFTGGNPNRQAMSVFLCAAEDVHQACEGRGAPTAAEKHMIEQRIRAMPEVTDVRFRNQQESLRDSGLIGAVEGLLGPSAVAESFRVVLADYRDIPEAKRKIRALPGVAQITPDQRPEDARRHRAEGEKKRDEVTIFLCERASAFPNCDGRKATKAHKDAIDTALRTMPEASSVEFVDRDKVWAQWLENTDGDTLGMTSEDVPECFIVRVPDLTQIEAFVAKVEAMKGVAHVVSKQDVLDDWDTRQGG